MKTSISANFSSRYLLVALATIFVVVIGSIAALGSAQVVNTFSCSASPSPVVVGQPVTLTLTGGNGTYTWSGINVNSTSNPSQVTAVFGTSGTYTGTVTSGTSTATCNVVVVDVATSTQPTSGGTTSGPLSCTPATQTVALGSNASMSASGGNGTYVWSSPDLTINNTSGSGFSANFASAGQHTVTVSSGGGSSTCTVTVTSSSSGGGTVTPPTTPGLPATGGGYGH